MTHWQSTFIFYFAAVYSLYYHDVLILLTNQPARQTAKQVSL